MTWSGLIRPPQVGQVATNRTSARIGRRFERWPVSGCAATGHRPRFALSHAWHLGLLDNHANHTVSGLGIVIPHRVLALPFHIDRDASM
ncbi:hypothetical protein [Lentzea cavernae]|uniref:hypothetical protein n=1 Tax=Lentzea cavernae TaxID=2020703 RepID=UPI00174DFB58|nr:hypothetical protein [Lentzea cavernae]